MKKLIGAVLAMSLTAALLPVSGCSLSRVKLSEKDGVYVYDEQIELRVPVYDRGLSGGARPEDNYWTRYIQENFGDKHNIKITFVPVPRSNDANAFKSMIAQNEAPDIIFTYDYPTAMQYFSMNAISEIDMKKFKKYAPDYYEYTKESLRYGEIDGAQFFFTATRPDFDSYVTLIRTDWLDKCGLDMPKTPEEYRDMLRAFLANGCGGADTVPATYTPGDANYGGYQFREYPMDEEEKAMYSDISVCPFTYEPVRQALLWDNGLYNEGLISPEWYLDANGAQAFDDFTSGRAGIYSCYLPNDALFAALNANCPDARIDVLGQYEQPTPDRKYWNFGMLSGISAQCRYPEAVMLYLDWLARPENLFVLQNGLEGITYDMADGCPIMKNGYSGEEQLINGTNKDLWCLVTEAADYGSDEKNKLVRKHQFVPEGYEYIIDSMYKAAEAKAPFMYEDTLFTSPIESLARYKDDLLEKWLQYKTELITCRPDAFDDKYNKYKKQYLIAGYSEILEEKKEAYRNGEYMRD